MIGAIASLGGALGAGGLVGLIKMFIEYWLENKRLEKKMKHEADLAFHKQLTEYQNNIHKFQEVELEKDVEWKISFIGHELLSYKGKKRKETIARSLASWFHSISLLMLTSALVWVCLIWANAPDVPLRSINPEQEPTKFSFLWRIIEWSFHKANVQEWTTGGAAFLLLHGIMVLIGYVLIGTRWKR
jgi:hypothetical protein